MVLKMAFSSQCKIVSTPFFPEGLSNPVRTGSSVTAAAEVLPEFVSRESRSIWVPTAAAMSYFGTSDGI